MCRQANAAAKARRTQEEEELALEVAEAVKARVEEAMKSEAVAQRIQTRLTEERTKLEEKVRDLPGRQGCAVGGWVKLEALRSCICCPFKSTARQAEVKGVDLLSRQ